MRIAAEFIACFPIENFKVKRQQYNVGLQSFNKTGVHRNVSFLLHAGYIGERLNDLHLTDKLRY